MNNKNPGSMKNLIMAMVLMMGFLMFWNYFVVSRYSPAPGEAPAPETALESSRPQQPAAISSTPGAPLATIPVSKKETFLTISDPGSEVTWGSQGARILSWKVKENGDDIELVVGSAYFLPGDIKIEAFKSELQQGRAIDTSVMAALNVTSDQVQVLNEKRTLKGLNAFLETEGTGNEEGVDIQDQLTQNRALLQKNYPQSLPQLPISRPEENNLFPLRTFPELNFAVQASKENQVTWAADHPNGFRVTKTLALNSESFVHDFSLSITNKGNQSISVPIEMGWYGGIDKKNKDDQTYKDQAQMVQAEMRGLGLARKVKTWRPGFIFGRNINKIDKDTFAWAGVDNDHFLAAFLAPENGALTNVHVETNKNILPRVSFPLTFNLKPGETQTQVYQLFVGPKRMVTLKAAGRDLIKAVDFGFFGIISKGLLVTVNFFKSVTGNYGWAIIILTICYQILVFPLTKKSLQHSAKMREVQPQLKKLQAQFKSDPKRMQIETMNLYKKHGMKFMGMEGCFPILVQIPFFFAIYQTLRVAYELRGAPWILWIQDLSAPDPLYILPILMGLGTYLQQKLTMVSMDPAQAKMMLIMPVFLVFIFLRMPSGLVLYWFVQSIVTVIVQRFLQYKMHHPKPA